MTADTDTRQALLQAARAAGLAPSIHNTQPWKWVVSSDRLALYAASERHLHIQDPERRLLLTSCGAALHHAEVALAAQGWRHRVERPADSPLAVIHPEEQGPVDPQALHHVELLRVRHTDRRTVGDQPLDREVLDSLVRATEQAGARLHLLGRDQVIELAALVEKAQKTEAADESLRRETAAWVGGARPDGTGIPDAGLPEELPLTTVAERDFGTTGTLVAGPGHDTAATYAVVYGPGDEPADWLRSGEALDALWLAATEHGAALLPLSTPIEVPFVRHELRRLLTGIGYPHMVVRLGTVDAAHHSPGRTPRLPMEQVIEMRE